MKLIIKYKNIENEFENQASILIGNTPECDMYIRSLADNEVFKFVWSGEYNKYILINVYKNNGALCNNKEFSKILVPQKNFFLKPASFDEPINIYIEDESQVLINRNIQNVEHVTKEAQNLNILSQNPGKIFDSSVEKNRIAIIKEIGFKVIELKNTIKTSEIINLILSINMIVLSLVCSFGITNFLLQNQPMLLSFRVMALFL